MSESHDPVKDAFKHLFGKDKKEEEQPQNASPASDVTAAAAALGQQATVSNAVPSNPFADPVAPVEQNSAYANPYADPAQSQAQPAAEQPAEPAPTTYTNPFADNATPAPAAEAAPAPVENRAADTAATAHVEEPAPAPNPDVESINGHAVGYAFLRYYKEHPEIGLPVDEQHGNVGGYQMFEHAILKWDGQNVQVEQRGGGGGSNQGGGQRTYTVQSGDNLSAIAQQFYGDGGQWRKIYDANRDKISNPDLIHPGQQFIIP